MGKHLLIIGHLNIDHIITAEQEAEERPGGGALYTAFAAGIYGNTVDLLSVRCPDMPNTIFETMQRRHINTDNVIPVLGKQRRSFMAYDKNFVRTNFAHKTKTWQSATYEQAPRHLPLPGRSYDCLYLAPMLAENQLLYAQWGRSRDMLVAMDLSEYFAQENTEAVKACLQYLDLFLPSDIELNEIYPDAKGDLLEQVQRVRNAGVSILVVKRSVKGSLLCDFKANRYYVVGIRHLEHVIDATGAGDTFNGGFLSAYIASGDTVSSARYAAAVASCCIQAFSFCNLIEKTRAEIQTLALTVPYREILLGDISKI